MLLALIIAGRIQNMDPGPWTTPVDLAHEPHHGPGPWSTSVEPVHGPPHGPPLIFESKSKCR